MIKNIPKKSKYKKNKNHLNSNLNVINNIKKY